MCLKVLLRSRSEKRNNIKCLVQHVTFNELTLWEGVSCLMISHAHHIHGKDKRIIKLGCCASKIVLGKQE